MSLELEVQVIELFLDTCAVFEVLATFTDDVILALIPGFFVATRVDPFASWRNEIRMRQGGT